MDTMIEEYLAKYSIPEDGKKELIDILNAGIIEISKTVLAKTKDTSSKKETKTFTNKKFASKKAEEYAFENNLTMEDFDMEKITKKDVEEKVREKTKEQKSDKFDHTQDSTIEKSNKIEKKVLCCGLTKKGEQCTRVGTLKPDGAKKMYCFRHADEWNAFECESDSSDEELFIEKMKDKNTTESTLIENEEQQIVVTYSDSESEY